MNFKKIDINSFKDISPFFKHQQSMACEYSFGILYFWKDYFNYQSDIAEKLEICCKVLHSHGFEFIYIEDLLK